MRTGRNYNGYVSFNETSLDHWDMRTGRNYGAQNAIGNASLDHWDMRTGRNLCWLLSISYEV